MANGWTLIGRTGKTVKVVRQGWADERAHWIGAVVYLVMALAVAVAYGLLEPIR